MSLNKAESHSILGEIFNSRSYSARKKKRKSNVKPAQELIIAFDFLKETLNKLNKFSELKGFYLVIVNVPTYCHEEI
jgi:hypothetical protein